MEISDKKISLRTEIKEMMYHEDSPWENRMLATIAWTLMGIEASLDNLVEK